MWILFITLKIIHLRVSDKMRKAKEHTGWNIVLKTTKVGNKSNMNKIMKVHFKIKKWINKKYQSLVYIYIIYK